MCLFDNDQLFLQSTSILYCLTALKCKTMPKIPKPALNLKQFMLRQEVLTLYRDIFRTIRCVPGKNSQAELRGWARHDFRTNQHQTDEMTIKMLLKHGRRNLTELRTNLELSGQITGREQSKK